jgi:hypothetical protein
VSPGATITVEREMRGTPNDAELADPPTPGEEAAGLVEVAPIGQRAVVLAQPGDTDAWELVSPASIVFEDDQGQVRTIHPRTGEVEQVFGWDDYLAEIERALALDVENPAPAPT